jgi:hypothetical protein
MNGICATSHSALKQMSACIFLLSPTLKYHI